MFKIAVVVFRECLEIALLLGIIMAVTKQINNSRIYILMGALLGTVLASLFAFFARSVSVMFSGLGDEIFDSTVILLTAFIISWTVAWMQGYSAKIRKDFDELSRKINSGLASQFMLVFVVSMTVLREGSEIILFLYSISSAEKVDVNGYIIGLGAGAAAGFFVGSVLYFGLIKIASKYIFRISTVLLVLIAAGLAAEAAGILTSSGIIEAYSTPLWDSSWLVDDYSISGKLLKILIGYDAKPNGMQLIFYFSAIAFNLIMVRLRKYLSKKDDA